MVKKLILGVVAAVSGLLSLLSLWGTIYWHWESTKDLAAEEVEQAKYDYDAWFFYLCIFVVLTILFSVLFLRYKRPDTSAGE